MTFSILFFDAILRNKLTCDSIKFCFIAIQDMDKSIYIMEYCSQLTIEIKQAIAMLVFLLILNITKMIY